MKKVYFFIIILLLHSPLYSVDVDVTELISVTGNVIPAVSGDVKRINCNGLFYSAADGNIYYEDTAYSTLATQGYIIAGSTASTSDAISATADQMLYQTNRWGNIEYRFDLPVGMYNITLKFAETNFNAAGQRVFNVFLHDLDTGNRGIKVLGDFDIFTEAGGHDIAVDRTISNITVNEGFLKMTFEGITDQPCICAIEVASTPYVIGDIGMSDDDFINMVEHKAFNWFYDMAETPYYLAPAWGASDGVWDVGVTNIAGIGFQLIVYCIGIERGWMSYEEGYSRVKGIFDGIKLMPRVLPDGTISTNPYERYCHYYNRLDPAIARPDMDEEDPCSIFDNGDFMMGVVFAEEYFRGTEVELMAKQVYESLDWNKYGDYANPAYSEEMIAVLLGASSPRSSCRNITMIDGFNNATGDLHSPLYFYQWLNLFYDGRYTSTPGGRNDFDFARDATLTNRQDFISLWQSDPADYNTYDWDSWGFTAATREGEYGYRSHYGGDINPFAVAASLPFAPSECLNAMKHMYYRFYLNGYHAYTGPIWSNSYGFCQTYNIGSSYIDFGDPQWTFPYSKQVGNGAFDFGSIVMGIENHRTGLVWQHTMNSEYIKAGMYRIGMTGYTTPPSVNIAENKPFAVSSTTGTNTGDKALDDNLITRWESDYSSNSQWIYVDLQDSYDIDNLEIFWKNAYAVSYRVQTSFDASNWTDVYSTASGDGAVDRVNFSPAVTGRYVRVYCTEKSLNDYGYSIWGLRVFGDVSLAPPSMVDNFEDGEDPNLWGGDYIIMDDSGTLTKSYDADNARGGSGYAMALNYNVPADGNWCGVMIQLANDWGLVDISSYEYLNFWVKGSVANIPLKIELENGSGGSRCKAKLYITDYLDGGVTTSWQEVKIPLDAFCNLDSFENVMLITFVFEHNYAVDSGFQTTGILYIDDIGFGTENPLDYVRIDHFGDNENLNALGGEINDMPSTSEHSHSYENLETSYHNYSRGMKSDYNVNLDPYWGGIWTAFGGGSNKNTSQECDFLDYRYLTFYVRAQDSNTNPEVFRIDIVDSNSTEAIFVPDNTEEGNVISTNWQKYTIDLNNITGLDKSSIKQMNIVYEAGLIEDKSGNKNGVLYFDEIQFEK